MTLLSNYWTLSSFVFVIISASIWPSMPHWFWVYPIILFSIFCIRYKKLRVLVGISLAIGVVLIQGNRFKSQTVTLFQTSQDITINVKINSIFKPINHGYEGVVTIKTINGKYQQWLMQPKIRLITSFPLMIGDEVTLNVTIKPIIGQLNDSGFDQEKYYFSQHVIARAVATSTIENTLITPSSNFRRDLYIQVKEKLKNVPQAGILLALSFGERGDISPEQWQHLKNSGLIHLIAISGLHIGIAYMLGYAIGLLFSRLNQQWLWAPFIMGCLLAFTYAWLAGFTLPTQRALSMCLINVFMLMLNIKLNMIQRLLITLSLVLTLDPFATLSSSFWMSFLAVMVVCYHIAQMPMQTPFWQRLILTQIKLVISMMPITIYFFHGISLSSAIYNLVFIPWFSFIVVPCIFLVLLMDVLSLSIAQQGWLWVSNLLIPVEWAMAYSTTSWLPISNVMFELILAAVVIWKCAPLISHRVLYFAWGMVILSWWFTPVKTGWRVEVLDVGHGLSVLIEKNGRYVLYDTGASWSGGDYVQSVITPLLIQRGAIQLDGLILSHLDNDHAGGKEAVKLRWNPKWQRASQKIAGYQACTRGESWSWQGLQFDVLWPPQIVTRAYNPHSCVIRIVDEFQQAIFLTGDIDAMSEWLLVRDAHLMKSEVMLVPHHGSKTSSIQALINRVQPSFAIASLAKGNRWNMPAPQVVERYENISAQWWDTGEAGKITINYHNNAVGVSSLRLSRMQPWYRQMLRKGVE